MLSINHCDSMKTAIVHDWIINIGGAERVLRELYKIFKDSDIYTLICKEEIAKKFGIENKRIKTSFLQSIPFSAKFYRYMLPLMPNAIESFDLSGYDLIISSSHCVAKGVLTNSYQIHLAYVHTPMRYAWDMYHSYLRDSKFNKGLRGLIAGQIFKKIRIWDLSTANRPDYYIANSYYVAKKIKKIYGKDSLVIYPPVDISLFSLRDKKEDFYITAGRLVPYKKVDLIVEAFSRLKDRKLIVIGKGSEIRKLKSIATKNIDFIGHVDEKTLANYLGRAKAFIFAAEEDFGILPVEAQGCGTPVIAFRGGGVTETVIDGKTGIFFEEQSAQAIIDAVKKFEEIEERFSPAEIRKNSERFSTERFREEIISFIQSISKTQ